MPEPEKPLPLEAVLEQMAQERVLARIWEHDHTLWKPEPTEISNRLGWLHVADTMLDSVYRLEELVKAVQADAYTHALLLGMGGSSLAPEVFRKTFGVGDGYLDLAVLDSTDPGAVLAHTQRLNLARTLFIVATKSGGTVETLSLFKYFYNQVMDVVGKDWAGEHFVAITDPGSRLEDLAKGLDFREIFLNDPNIGGRYSALSYFGLVPAALTGVNVSLLLERARLMVSACSPDIAIQDNPAARLGAAIAEWAKAGRDKMTFIISPFIDIFGDWVEQLVAESTGKEGNGILPVVGESPGPPDLYGEDRLFAYLRLDDENMHNAAADALEQVGYPVLRLHLRDVYDLGGQFFLWELATALAGHRLGINPFDQPNVEEAKMLARRMVAEYTEKGILPAQPPALVDGEISVYGDVSARSMGEALTDFLEQARVGDYIALQAYIQPTMETGEMLGDLQARLRDRTKLATTLGYGPRFLHSTGQLHKGDAGNGLFVQITTDSSHDLPIPDEAGSPHSSVSFGVLKAAQAMGDRQALLDAGRRVLRLHLVADVTSGLKRVLDAIS